MPVNLEKKKTLMYKNVSIFLLYALFFRYFSCMFCPVCSVLILLVKILFFFHRLKGRLLLMLSCSRNGIPRTSVLQNFPNWLILYYVSQLVLIIIPKWLTRRRRFVLGCSEVLILANSREHFSVVQLFKIKLQKCDKW